MKYIQIFYLILLTNLYSFGYSDELPDDLSVREVTLPSESEPIAIIGGCVNAISGCYFQVDTDLVSNSIEPIKLTRYYDSESKLETSVGVGFGFQFPIIATETQKNARHSYALIGEREGSFLTYQGNYSSEGKDKRRDFWVDDRVMKKCYTSSSGQTNLINWSGEHKTKNSWVVKTGDGTKRFYEKKVFLSKEGRKKLSIPTENIFLLTKEVKPNGIALEFEYTTKKDVPFLTKIKSLSRSGSHVINEINLYETPHGFVATTPSGNNAIYENKPTSYKSKDTTVDRNLLNYVSTTNFGHYKYSYEALHKGRRKAVKAVSKLNGYQQLVNYDDGKVSSLSHTVGPNNKLVETHTFKYHSDRTYARDCIGRELQYFFDSKKRVSEIIYCSKSASCTPFSSSVKPIPQTPIRRDTFKWSQEKGQEGWLRLKGAANGKGLYFYLKQFEFDSRGNITQEKLYGNIKGDKKNLFLYKNEVDCYDVHHTYLAGDYNLIDSTVLPGGLTIKYEYVAFTNLVNKETQSYNGKIQERIFRSYDDNAQVCLVVEDDGSGAVVDDLTDVTYQKITTIKGLNAPGHPAFGKPESMEKSFVNLDTKERILLTKTDYHYDHRGNLIGAYTFDKGVLVAEELMVYDDQNRLTKKSDPKFINIYYEYDENSNKTKEYTELRDVVKTYFYDSANRLTALEYRYNDNDQPFITHYVYNEMGEKVKEIDQYGNETHFVYDTFGKEIERILPAVQKENGEAHVPRIRKKFNEIGQEISHTDAEGNTTHYQYNIFGSVIRKVYPDGSEENNSYYSTGLLKANILSNGTKTSYHYDPKGRVTLKEIHDKNNTLIAKETYIFKGANLILSADLSGIETKYSYDHAGRLIKISIGEKETKYELDGLGRNVAVIEGERVFRYQYNVKGDLVRFTKEDLAGTLYYFENYAYDEIKKENETVAPGSDGVDVKSSTYYNANQTVKSEIDKEGKQTSWIYNYGVKNALNQNVLETTTVSPSGRKNVSTYDASGNCVKEEIIDSGKTISSKETVYNLVNLPVRITNIVLEDDNELRTYVIRYKYDALGNVKEMNENGEKVTGYTYDFLGNLTSKVLPNGTVITMEYDGLSRCLTRAASDNSFSYKYRYDARGNLVETQDLVHKVSQKRSYDKLDRLLGEELLKGYKVTFSYDIHDRLKELTLPDNSKVEYRYNPYHLSRVKRTNKLGSYEIDCTKYAMSGQCLETSSKAGKTAYTYDKMGRSSKISSKCYETAYSHYDLSGNLTSESETSPKGLVSKTFAYDSLNQLVSERGPIANDFKYDSLGNCLKENGSSLKINTLNQLVEKPETSFEYDKNGNLAKENSHIHYTYDANGRLVTLDEAGVKTQFIYDGTNRCLEIVSDVTKTLLYQQDKEIGAMIDGELREFKLTHPSLESENTFAVEIDYKPYYVQQDARYNIVLLQNDKGQVEDQYVYSTFKEEQSDSKHLSPWRLGNRRQVGHLSLFKHRLYHPDMRRWLTQDPLGFADGYNHYGYSGNNPYRYYDKDGREIVCMLVLTWEIGTLVFCQISTTQLIATAVAAAACYGVKNYDFHHGTNYCEMGQGTFVGGMYVMPPQPMYCDGIPVSPTAGTSPNATPKPEENVDEELDPSRIEGVVVPEDPSQLFPDKPRDRRGRILLDSNTRLRPEQHNDYDGSKPWNPRHHGPHVHVESKKDPSIKSWNKNENIYKHKPPGYTWGEGTGFVPGETLPNLTIPKG